MFKKVLVTGSEGFIGSHLVERLLEAGIDVKAFILYNSFGSKGWLDTLPQSIKGNIETVYGDIREYHTITKAMKGCDAVFHLAALISKLHSEDTLTTYIDTNVKGTANVMQAAHELGIKKVIHTSSSEVYGSTQIIPVVESHSTAAKSSYSASKIGADQIALSFYHSLGTPITIARPFNTYGPRQSTEAIIPTIISQFINKNNNTIKLGTLYTTRDFNYCTDIADALISILNANTNGEIINIGSGFETSISDLYDTISDIIGIRKEIRQDETRLRSEKSDIERLCASNEKIFSLTNWSPKFHNKEGFKKGLEKTIEWFSNSNNLRLYKKEPVKNKLKNQDLSKKYDDFTTKIVLTLEEIKKNENNFMENAFFIKNNIQNFIDYQKIFFGSPSISFEKSIDTLTENSSLHKDIQKALTVFHLIDDKVQIEGYDSITNTNIKEIFSYLWHLCSLTNDMSPILMSLKEIKKNLNLTNAAIILSNEWIHLLHIHSLPKTKDLLTTQLRKKHIKKLNPWMNDALAWGWADEYPTKYLLENKINNINPEHPFIVNNKTNQVDGINGLTLYHHPRPGNADSGYYASSFEGRSRKECLNILLQHIDNQYYIDLIFPEIEANILKKAIPQSWKDHAIITKNLSNTLELKEYLKTHTHFIRDYLKGMIIGDHMPDFDQKLSYIPHQKNNYKSTGIFDVLAELGGYNLIIYNSNQNNIYDIHINHYHLSQNADKNLHILHKDERYDLLFEKPFLIDFSDSF